MQYALLFLLSFNSYSAIEYYTQMYGHIHQNPNARSSSLTAIQCGDPVTIIEGPNVIISDDWSFVKFGDSRGYVMKDYMAKKRPTDCFRGKYPKFHEKMGLDLKQIYYWGRLYDQYVQGESTLK
jgi:hypothetical protein